MNSDNNIEELFKNTQSKFFHLKNELDSQKHPKMDRSYIKELYDVRGYAMSLIESAKQIEIECDKLITEYEKEQDA